MSQNKRMESILTENNILEDKMIVKSPDNISEHNRMEISEILDYFRYNHSLDDVCYLPENFDMEELLGLL